MAKLMLSGANFLILDEPTNHLDMESKEILEKALNGYTGTLLYVSHDRYFINKTAKRVLALHNDHFENYLGNYDYYLQKFQESMDGTENTEVDKSLTTEPSSEGKKDWVNQKKLQSEKRKIQNQIDKIEQEIAEIEEKLESLNEDLMNPENASNSAKLNEISAQQEKLQSRLDECYQEWESLSENELLNF